MSTAAEFKISVCEDAESVAGKVADAIEDLATSAGSGEFNIALSGGSTPRAVYALLAKRNLPWDRVRLFWGDERRVKPDHPDSNYRMAYEALLKNGPVPLENIFPIPTAEPTVQECAARYEQTLHEKIARKAEGFPVFDLILLGIGPDGHTASLFPGTPAPLERTHAVTPCDPVEANPAVVPAVERITITAPVIWHAANVFVLAVGESKREMLEKVFASGSLETPVARLLWRCTGQVRFFLDPDAFPRK